MSPGCYNDQHGFCQLYGLDTFLIQSVCACVCVCYRVSPMAAEQPQSVACPSSRAEFRLIAKPFAPAAPPGRHLCVRQRRHMSAHDAQIKTRLRSFSSAVLGTKAGSSLHHAELKPVADGLLGARTCLSPDILMCFGLVTPSRVFLQTVLVAKLLWERRSAAVRLGEDTLVHFASPSWLMS